MPGFEDLPALSLDLGVWGYVLAFLFAVGEALPFVGFFVPGQWIVVVAGFAAARGHYSLAAMLAVVVAGGVVGDALGYYLGRSHGRALLDRWGPRLHVDPARVAKAQAIFDRYGPVALVFARFTLVTRSLGPLFAGLNRMPQRLFWPLNVVGAIAWGCTYVLLGYAFGESAELLAKALGGAVLVVAALVVVAVVGVYVAGRMRLFGLKPLP